MTSTVRYAFFTRLSLPITNDWRDVKPSVTGTPKAFAISEKGHWWGAWSLTPKDTTLPTDPSERALVACQRNAGVPCKLYAVNGSVVWKP